MPKQRTPPWVAASLSLARRGILLVRGLMFLGRRHQCPVCGWHVRAFVGKRTLFRTSATGYCPRCNAKARHRRIWRYLEANLEIGSGRLLEIAPWSSFARRFRAMPGVEYIGIDLLPSWPPVAVQGDLVALPLRSESIDTTLCIHVLEHVTDDRQAIAELHRVLKPGGAAIISVPIRLDRPTFEDPSVTDPEERKKHFGERSHLRYYGNDFADRLRAAGFSVSMDPAARISNGDVRKYGLRRDENIFRCVKATGVAARAVHFRLE